MKEKLKEIKQAVFDKWILQNAVDEGIFSSTEEAAPFFESALKSFYQKKGIKGNIQVQFA